MYMSVLFYFRMRYGKIGLQLGAKQKYYISRCEEKHSIQLTITVVGNNLPSIEERKELIDNITQMLDNIMKLFMPAVHSRPAILLSCPLCPTLHITLNQVYSGNTIYCANASDDVDVVPPEYYSNFISTKSGSYNFAGFWCV